MERNCRKIRNNQIEGFEFGTGAYNVVRKFSECIFYINLQLNQQHTQQLLKTTHALLKLRTVTISRNSGLTMTILLKYLYNKGKVL